MSRIFNINNRMILVVVYVIGLSALILAETKSEIVQLPDTSTVIQAMRTELKRSMDSLGEKNLKPYFISYRYWEIQSFRTQASLGGLEASGRDREQYLQVDVRVGDYELDNTKFQGSIIFGPRVNAPLPEQNDSILLRQAIWARTDSEYKIAVEQLAQKKGFLENQALHKRPDDYSKQNVGQWLDAAQPMQADSASMENWCIEVSKVLSQREWLQESRSAFQYYHTTLYYVDSEGTSYIQQFQENTMLASWLAQANDGAPIWDYLRYSVRDPSNLPQPDTTYSQLDSLLGRMDFLRKQKPLEIYRGPVLFDGPASGLFIRASLLEMQKQLRPTMSINNDPVFLSMMMGKKYYPEFIDIVDQPSLKNLGKRQLHGYYQFDHEGQPAKKVELIKKGRISDVYRGKTPIFPNEKHLSNGHWRYGEEFPGVVQVKSNMAMTDKQIQQKLVKLSREEGNEYGLRVSKFSDEDALALLIHPLSNLLPHRNSDAGFGRFDLGYPLHLEQISVTDGKAIPVRGLEFEPVDSKSLRSMAGTGNKQWIYEPQASFTVVSPSLLLGLLDLKSRGQNWPRLPLFFKNAELKSE